MDEVGSHFFDERAQSLRGAANRQGTEPLSEYGAQAQAARRGGARALSRFFKRTKGNWDDFKSLNREVQRARKSRRDENFIPAFNEMTNPIDGNGGTSVNDKKNFHECGLYVIARWAETRYI